MPIYRIKNKIELTFVEKLLKILIKFRTWIIEQQTKQYERGRKQYQKK